jgi:hypothetical protein
LIIANDVIERIPPWKVGRIIRIVHIVLHAVLLVLLHALLLLLLVLLLLLLLLLMGGVEAIHSDSIWLDSLARRSKKMLSGCYPVRTLLRRTDAVLKQRPRGWYSWSPDEKDPTCSETKSEEKRQIQQL